MLAGWQAGAESEIRNAAELPRKPKNAELPVPVRTCPPRTGTFPRRPGLSTTAGQGSLFVLQPHLFADAFLPFRCMSVLYSICDAVGSGPTR